MCEVISLAHPNQHMRLFEGKAGNSFLIFAVSSFIIFQEHREALHDGVVASLSLCFLTCRLERCFHLLLSRFLLTVNLKRRLCLGYNRGNATQLLNEDAFVIQFINHFLTLIAACLIV